MRPETELLSMSVCPGDADLPVLTDVAVVTLSGGTLGLVAADPSWLPADGAVVLTAGERRVEGTARVVRSGPEYEETRGRLRARAGLRERWRLRREDPVLLVACRG